METISETVNQLAHTASKVIWGEQEQHEEPVSGQMGDVEAGEPYDAGNIGESNEAALAAGERMEAKRHSLEEERVSPRTSISGNYMLSAAGASAPQVASQLNPEPKTDSKPRWVEAKDIKAKSSAYTGLTNPVQLRGTDRSFPLVNPSPGQGPSSSTSSPSQKQSGTNMPVSATTTSASRGTLMPGRWPTSMTSVPGGSSKTPPTTATASSDTSMTGTEPAHPAASTTTSSSLPAPTTIPSAKTSPDTPMSDPIPPAQEDDTHMEDMSSIPSGRGDDTHMEDMSSVPSVPANPPSTTTTTTTTNPDPSNPSPPTTHLQSQPQPVQDQTYHNPSASSSASSIPHTPPFPTVPRNSLSHPSGYPSHHHHVPPFDKIKALKLAETLAERKIEEERRRQETQRYLSTDPNDDLPSSATTKPLLLSPAALQGPGPRPIADVAKEYGGDAGLAWREGRRDSAKGGLLNVAEEGEGYEGDEERGAGGGGEKGEGRKRKRRWSRKLASEGGDFDAAREGAAWEADLILEEKGIHHHGNHVGHRHSSVQSATTESSSEQIARKSTGGASSSSDLAADRRGSKAGLKEKIKEKLHLRQPSLGRGEGVEH